MFKLSGFFLRKINLILISLLLIVLYVLVLFWSALGFLTSTNFLVVQSFSISLFTIIMIIGLVYNYKFKEHISLKIIVINIVFFFLLIAFFCFVSTIFWDNSYDGQTYHLEGIHKMANGWNPFKTLLEPLPYWIFSNHYSKAFEIFGSSILQFTGEMETTKVSNLMLFFVAWVISFSYFKTIFLNKPCKSFVYATLIVLNPIITTQLFTLMFDCQLALLFIILVFSFLFYLQNKTWALIFLSSSLVILISVKFTGLVYACIFSFFACIYLLIFQNKNKKLFKKFILISFFTFLISISFISLNPYITNLTGGKHIFYPLMGENSIDIIKGSHSPASFDDKNRFQKFIIAYTSISSNFHGSKVVPEPKFKYPFEVHLKEWTIFKSAGILYGGLGPLFFSSIILAFFILLYLFLKNIYFKKQFIFLLTFILFSIFIVPECWLARYVPQLWYLPIIILIFYDLQIKKTRLFNLTSKILCYLLMLNGAIILMIAILSNYIITQQQKNEYIWLKNAHTSIKMISNGFKSTEYRLNKYKINYQMINDSDTTYYASSMIFKPISSSSVLILPKNTPAYTPSRFFKYLESYVKNGK